VAKQLSTADSNTKPKINNNWVSAQVTYKLKKPSKGYVGFTARTFAFASERPTTLSILILCMVTELIEFYALVTNVTADEINKEIKEAAACIINLQVK
jgi:hypothetical protein